MPAYRMHCPCGQLAKTRNAIGVALSYALRITYGMSELREIRRRLGLNQTAMGEKLGVDQSTISRWEGADGDGPPAGMLLAAQYLELAALAANRDQPDA